MACMGYYDHLNAKPVPIPIAMEDLAKLIAAENYGLQRLLTAVVRIRRKIDEDFKRAHPSARPDGHSMLTEAIADALEKGGY